MKISSPAFSEKGIIPDKYTCRGQDINPPLLFEDVPPGAKTLTLIVDDPDAPGGTWTHWLVANIPSQTQDILEDSTPDGMQGVTDFGRRGYGGPCPPSGEHRYFFKLYALDTILALEDRFTKQDLLVAMEGHVLAQAELVGIFKK
jgi:Raf kinase inhibitor-like YbhB/YbcL family protein